MAEIEGIPVKHTGVNIADLHPELKSRLRAALYRPELLTAGARVSSGARTYAEQRYLYDGYQARRKGFNLAANPDQVNSDGSIGSRHQVQRQRYVPGYFTTPIERLHLRAATPPAGAAWAADVGFYRGATRKRIDALEHAMVAEGLMSPISSEWWHFELSPTKHPTVPYTEDDDMGPTRPVRAKGGVWLPFGSPTVFLNVTSPADRQAAVNAGWALPGDPVPVPDSWIDTVNAAREAVSRR